MVSHHPHRPQSPSTRLIVIALVASVLLHIWLLTSSVPNWTKVQLPEPTTLSVQLAPPQQPRTVVTPPTVESPPIHPQSRQPTTHQRTTPRHQTTLPRQTATPTDRPQIAEPAVPTTRETPTKPVVAPQNEGSPTIKPPSNPVRPARTPRTPSGTGGTSMGQLRSQLAGLASEDDAPQSKFSKIQMTYPSASCTGSCRSYATSLVARLQNMANANKPNQQNGEIVRMRVTAIISPNGSVRSVSISNPSGNRSVESLARSQTQSVSMPPFPADMASRASSLRVTFGWYAEKIAP